MKEEKSTFDLDDDVVAGVGGEARGGQRVDPAAAVGQRHVEPRPAPQVEVRERQPHDLGLVESAAGGGQN